MGEEFQNHRGNGRQTGFAVIAVPQAAALPPDTELGGDILLQTGQYHVRQVAGSITGDTGVQFTAIIIGGIDTSVPIKSSSLENLHRCALPRSFQKERPILSPLDCTQNFR